LFIDFSGLRSSPTPIPTPTPVLTPLPGLELESPGINPPTPIPIP